MTTVGLCVRHKPTHAGLPSPSLNFEEVPIRFDQTHHCSQGIACGFALIAGIGASQMSGGAGRSAEGAAQSSLGDDIVAKWSSGLQPSRSFGHRSRRQGLATISSHLTLAKSYQQFKFAGRRITDVPVLPGAVLASNKHIEPEVMHISEKPFLSLVPSCWRACWLRRYFES